MKKTTLLFLCALLLFLTPVMFAGGKKEAKPETSKITTLNVAVPALPEPLTAGASTTQARYRVQYNIFNNLIEFDFKGTKGFMPSLAESWKRIDDRTLELKLRKGVKFHNGDEFTAEDVAWTFSDERFFGENPIVGHKRARGYWALFDRVEIIDPYTIRIISKDTDPLAVNRLSLPQFQIINKRAFQEAKSFEEWSNKPVGTGPFKIERFASGDQLVLKAHNEYWGGKPYVDTLIFRSVPEESARIAGLMAGDYQVISNVSIDLIPTIEQEKNLSIEGGPIASFLATMFNIKKPYMDVNLRKAMSLALDRELIVKNLFAGRTTIPNGINDPGYADMYVKDHPYPKYDLAEAKKLVKKSVYKGEVIPYYILNDYYPNEVNVAQTMVEMWKAAGINVQIEIKENWAQVNAEESEGLRYFGMRNTSNTDTFGDPAGCLWRTYNQSYDPYKVHGWRGPLVDEFMELGKVLDTSVNQKERYKAFARMLEIYDEDPPGLYFYMNLSISAKQKSIDWTAYKQVYMYFGPENFKQ